MLHIANPIYDSVFKYLMEDDDMRRIVTRLLSAASDTQVRHSMNIEEEISMALENRDTEIMGFRRASAAFQWCYKRDDCIIPQRQHRRGKKHAQVTLYQSVGRERKSR